MDWPHVLQLLQEVLVECLKKSVKLNKNVKLMGIVLAKRSFWLCYSQKTLESTLFEKCSVY
jgi:hypothetical protein